MVQRKPFSLAAARRWPAVDCNIMLKPDKTSSGILSGEQLALEVYLETR